MAKFTYMVTVVAEDDGTTTEHGFSQEGQALADHIADMLSVIAGVEAVSVSGPMPAKVRN